MFFGIWVLIHVKFGYCPNIVTVYLATIKGRIYLYSETDSIQCNIYILGSPGLRGKLCPLLRVAPHGHIVECEKATSEEHP